MYTIITQKSTEIDPATKKYKWSHLWSGPSTEVPFNKFDGQTQVYQTVNEFKSNYSRKERYLSRLKAFYVDVDVGRKDTTSTVEDAYRVMDEVVANNLLPEPSFRVKSGQGCYFVWLTDAPYTFNNLLLYKLVNKKIQSILLAKDPQLPIDDCADGARVLRKHGTINAKNGNRCTWKKTGEQNHDFNSMIAQLAITIPPVISKQAKTAKIVLQTVKPEVEAKTQVFYTTPVKSNANPLKSNAGKAGHKALAVKRVEEILEAIRVAGITEGKRHATLYMLGVHLRHSKTSEFAAREVIAEANALFVKPLPVEETNLITQQVYAIEKTHKYSGAGIATFFNLSLEQCKKMGFTTIGAHAKKISTRALVRAEVVRLLAHNPNATTREIAKLAQAEGMRISHVAVAAIRKTV